MSKVWKDRVVDVSELKLDLQNPRLPKYVKDRADENTIRDYMLQKEKIDSIARSIADNGYHHSATSIAYEDTDGRLIVLDGNRRLAASQLLINPALAADAKIQRRYENLSKEMPANALSKIKVTIAPSRKDAEKEIWDIHVTPTAKPWEVLQKLRMYRNLMETGDYDVSTAAHDYGMSEGRFKSELAKLYLYEQIDERTDPAGQEELLNSGFNKIQRVMQSTSGKKLLDMEVGGDGEVKLNNAGEFEANLVKMIPFIVEPNKVTAQSTQDELYDVVYSVVDPKQFPPKKKANGGTAKPTKTSTVKKSNGTITKDDWITDREYKLYSGEERVKMILEELKKNKPQRNTNLNMVSISLRVAIELAIYDVLKNKGHITKIIANERAKIKAENAGRARAKKPIVANIKADWTPSLNIMLDYMLVEANRVITDPQERRALALIQKSKKEYMEDLNSFMHNVSYKPTESSTRDIWDTFGRPIFDIIKKI